MNKGLEVIEAHWLFGLPVERIQVVIHPQSIIHSLVEFIDSSLVCQMSRPDMRLPIQYALTYPERVDSDFGRLEVQHLEQLTFFPPDLKKFPCLQLAYDAIKVGRSMPCVLSAANEVAVDNFLQGRIEFVDIAPLVALTLGAHTATPCRAVEELLVIDQWARQYTQTLINRKN
jgi:1-deoxy-D-xylulose-5-phosphate reductoisomerase